MTPGHNSEDLYRLDSLGIGSGNSNSFSKVVFWFTYWVKNWLLQKFASFQKYGIFS